jgi:hypothetical protein
MNKFRCILASLLAVGMIAVIAVNVNLAKIKSETFSNSIIVNLALSSENAQHIINCVTNSPGGSKTKPISGSVCPRSGCDDYYSIDCVYDVNARGCTEVICSSYN